MSAKEITATLIEDLRPLLKDNILDLIIEVLNEIKPNIISRTQIFAESHLNETHYSADNHRQLEKEVRDFKNRNYSFFVHNLQRRGDIYYKHSRCIIFFKYVHRVYGIRTTVYTEKI